MAAEADPAIRTTSEYLLAHLDDPSVVTCDTRGAEEYAGTDVRLPAAATFRVRSIWNGPTR
ncbi:MAG: hypothetical protein R2911_06585 [Caldilineaceae bacterium]